MGSCCRVDAKCLPPLRKTVNKTALVTGATGFIGTHLVRFLQAKGWNLVGTYCVRDTEAPAQSPNRRTSASFNVTCVTVSESRNSSRESSSATCFIWGRKACLLCRGRIRFRRSNRTSWVRCTCSKQFVSSNALPLLYWPARALSTATYRGQLRRSRKTTL